MPSNFSSAGSGLRWAGKIAALAVLALATAGSLYSSDRPGGGRYRLLFDDYYQKPRPDDFSEGVPANGSDRKLSNFYSTDANAIPNGTFVFSHLIADKFDVGVSDRPITPELLQSTDAYLLICPIKAEAGGRADLTEREASLLEGFVARGGMLGLILNSMPSDPSKSDFDWAGMNRIARRFGLEFLSETTNTWLIPVTRDHPLFDGVGGVIYGNGTTLRALPAADPKRIVLLRDQREGPHAPVGIIARYRKGKVLLFGDSGSFGNAHCFRNDTDQARALQQMIYGLLPDGPAPAYGWKEGTRLRVRLRQEQVFSCYPEGNRLFHLPKAPGTVLIVSGVRALDLASAPDQRARANPGRYASAVSRDSATFVLQVGPSDGRAYAATWGPPAGAPLSCRVLPKGTILDSSVSSQADLVRWQWALINEIICAPLKPYARPGEVWDTETLTPLPQAQLQPVPTLVRAPARIEFEGEHAYKGKSCLLFTLTTSLTADTWKLEDLVSPEYLSQAGPDQIGIFAGGLYAVTRFWVDRASLLPVHTEMKVSSSLWWKDEKYPWKFVGTHDWKDYENWSQISFVATFGRLLTADFEVP